MGTLLFVTSMFAVIFITRGYHDIYMRTVITVSDLREKYMDPEPIAEVTDVEKLEVHDEIRLAKKLPVVPMKERITRKKDDLVFVQKLKAGTIPWMKIPRTIQNLFQGSLMIGEKNGMQ